MHDPHMGSSTTQSNVTRPSNGPLMNISIQTKALEVLFEGKVVEFV